MGRVINWGNIDLFNKKKVDKLQGVISNNNTVMLELQESILTAKGVESSNTYKGNEYGSYKEAVAEIGAKYFGTAKWGVWAGNIIDVRSAFIIGRGLRIVNTGDSKGPEMDWANEFMDYNRFEISLPIIFANEAEIEGKFLSKLFIDEEDKEYARNDYKIKARYMSWRDYAYTVVANAKDYLRYEKIKYQEDTIDKFIPEAEFVYRKFGGRVSDPNSATPKLWRSLTQIDDISKAYRDWRKINSLFASPTPTFTFAEAKDAETFSKQIINWKIGKRVAIKGDFKYVVPDISFSSNLKEEILMKLKSLSGNTGVPVHFIGLPDLMSNRATAENLMELIWASTRNEREIWESAYTEIVRKAMLMRNLKRKSNILDPRKVKVEIPEISSSDWEQLEKVYMPLFKFGAISLHLLLSKIPNINIEEEEKRQKQNQVEQDEKDYALYQQQKKDDALEQDNKIKEDIKK